MKLKALTPKNGPYRIKSDRKELILKEGQNEVFDLGSVVPEAVRHLKDPQVDIPRIARSPELTRSIEIAVQRVPTKHTLIRDDARTVRRLPANSVHLVLTSPPYWTLKDYRDHPGQPGRE